MKQNVRYSWAVGLLLSLALVNTSAAWATTECEEHSDLSHWLSLPGSDFQPVMVRDNTGACRLRITDVNPGQASGIAFDQPIATNEQVTLDFVAHMYGGNGPGSEGMAVVLSTWEEAQLPDIGAGGAALGYAPGPTKPGFDQAWLGVGFDVLGRFATAADWRPGGSQTPSKNIALRGSGNDREGYDFLIGAMDGPVRRGGREQDPGQRYRIVIDGRFVNDGELFVSVYRSQDSSFSGLRPVIQAFNLLEIENQTARPDFWRLSITAATGHNGNYHEVSELSLTSAAATKPLSESTQPTILPLVTLSEEAPVIVEDPEITVEAATTDTDLDIEPEIVDAQDTSPRLAFTRFNFHGNTAFNDEQLIQQLNLDQATDHHFSLDELQNIAQQLTDFYHQQGYPFARALLPHQRLDDQQLDIAIVEGRYDQITVHSDDSMLRAGTEHFLYPLQSEGLIYSPQLERTMLVLSDQPGIETQPRLRPSERRGYGHLDVSTQATDRYRFFIGLDNHGNRYTGEYRSQAQMSVNQVFTFGDQVSFQALYTDEGLWLGQLGYERPLHYNGLRGQASYSRTDYTLPLIPNLVEATGISDIYQLGLSYPLLRSQQTNWNLSISYQYKKMRDEYAFPGVKLIRRRSSHSLPISIQVDHRDSIYGGGISFASLTLTPGDLDNSWDEATEGNFFKANVQFARLQNLPHETHTAYFALNLQTAAENLDPSETMTLGGASGVRAFAPGEGSGSKGYLLQTEIRQQLTDEWQHYLFMDVGGIMSFDDEGRRAIGGLGTGARYNYQGWRLDALIAFPLYGEAADPRQDRVPRFWFSGGYQF